MVSALVDDSLLFLLSAGVAILVLVTAHETIPARYSSFGSSPIGTLVRRSGCYFGGRHFALYFGCHALHKPSPHDLGCSCVLAYVSFYISCIGFLQQWPYASVAEFDVSNLVLAFSGPTFVEPPPSGVLIVSARKTGVVSPGS